MYVAGYKFNNVSNMYDTIVRRMRTYYIHSMYVTKDKQSIIMGPEFQSSFSYALNQKHANHVAMKK